MRMQLPVDLDKSVCMQSIVNHQFIFISAITQFFWSINQTRMTGTQFEAILMKYSVKQVRTACLRRLKGICHFH